MCVRSVLDPIEAPTTPVMSTLTLRVSCPSFKARRKLMKVDSEHGSSNARTRRRGPRSSPSVTMAVGSAPSQAKDTLVGVASELSPTPLILFGDGSALEKALRLLSALPCRRVWC